MEITVEDATGTITRTATVPGDAPAGRFLMQLVDKMGLPAVGPDGQPLSYKLHHKASGLQVDDQQSLEDARVQDGDVLRLVSELTAG
ncbi:MAG: EsaB/YukD family protein [Actinomycetes bacterium]